MDNVHVLCNDIEKILGNCQWMADCRSNRRIGSSQIPCSAVADYDDDPVSRIMPSKSVVSVNKGSRLVELYVDEGTLCGGNLHSNQVLSNRKYSSSFASISMDQRAGKEKLSSPKFSNSFGSPRTVTAAANWNDGCYTTSSLSRASSFTEGSRAIPVAPSYKNKFAVLMDQARLNEEARTTRVQKAKREGRNQAEPSGITIISGSGRSPRAPHTISD
jgi:hypothetical protein